jgi:hypothetical protein
MLHGYCNNIKYEIFLVLWISWHWNKWGITPTDRAHITENNTMRGRGFLHVSENSRNNGFAATEKDVT